MTQLRSVIYCRVSTAEQVQKDALSVQVQEAMNTVKAHGWTLTDQYVESVSGTTAAGRKEYLRMLEDVAKDKFDIIVIKSLDRINRNAKDWYLLVDKITQYDKKIFIYLENSFYQSDNNLLVGIKVILAEQYSRDLSVKLNNAHHYRQENGTNVILTNKTYGFKKGKDKKIYVCEEEAQTVRRMYELAALGYGARTISNILYGEGIVNRSGRQFDDSGIRRIIHNPLFKGTAVMNKSHYDFDKKKVVQNPESEWIYHEGIVPAIVDSELWEKANVMLSKKAGQLVKTTRKKRRGLYDFSGKLVCGECGRPYYKTFRRRYANREEQIVEWKCSTYLKCGRVGDAAREYLRKSPNQDGCNNGHLMESELIRMIEDLAQKLFDVKSGDNLIRKTMRILQKVLEGGDNATAKRSIERKLQTIAEKKEVLLDKLLDGIVSDALYQKKSKELEQEEVGLQVNLQKMLEEEQRHLSSKERLAVIQQRMQSDGFQRIRARLLMDLIQKIEVGPKELVIHIDMNSITGIRFKKGEESCIVRVSRKEYFSKTADIREEQKQEMLKMMRENPNLTNREAAKRLGVSFSTVRRWIERYEKEGVVKFEGKGGKGAWNVLKNPE